MIRLNCFFQAADAAKYKDALRAAVALTEKSRNHAGCIAYKIAAHAGDIARGLPGARKRDDEMALARSQFDWERQFDLALDPEKARAMRQEAIEERNSPTPLQGSRNGEHFCTMCGAKFCSIRVSKEI